MRVEFGRHNEACLTAKYKAQPGEYHRTEGSFICDDFLSGYHEGVWDSKLLSFRSKDLPPIESYEQFI